MRATLLTFGLLTLAPPAQAGVYNLMEQHPFVHPSQARSYILKLRSVAENPPGLPAPESFRAQILHQTSELEQLRAEGPFAVLDRVSLSACYLRLGRPKDALKLLLEEKSDHFLILANLASAYFQSGELEMARRTQQSVLDAWPTVWAGWPEQRRLFYRECERSLLLLFQARSQEKSRTRQPIDTIFPDKNFRFVGPGGKYQAGALSASMRDRLPENAAAVVFQLSSWYPGDLRIYWFLGESLNVMGHVDQASEILDELVRAGQSGLFLDLPEHRRTLRDALPAYREIQDPMKRGMLLSQLLAIPRPMPGAPVIGEAAYTAGSCVAIAAVPLFSKEVVPDRPEPTTGPELPFNWRHITVGFTFGFLVAALIGFQVQEWRRRKATSPPSTPEK